MADDHAYKIQIAADLIRQYTACDEQTALHIARRLWDVWHNRHDVRNLTPGEVAQRFRKRYERDICDPVPPGWSES